MSSFCITVRPKNGLHNEYDHEIMKYIEKHKYGAYVHEMEDEARHLHAQIWIDKKTDMNNIRKSLFRICEKCDPDYSPATKKVLSQGVKFAYNDDFVNKYMIKENEIEYKNIPEDTTKYYPTEEEQKEFKKKANHVSDAYFNKLKDLWEEEYPEYEFDHNTTKIDIARFYYNLMFRDKKIAVIRDDKMRKANCKCLLHYIYPNQTYMYDMVLTQNEITELKIHNNNI